MKLIHFFRENIPQILEYTLQHLILTGLGIFMAIVLWVTIGILIRRYEKLAAPILGFGSLIMCIPSIALYGLLLSLPFFGLNRTTALLALVMYSMLPIVRNVYIGLKSVDNSIIESAKGMGMSKRQILFQIEIPIAMPTILAGVRVTLVMMVGIATLATYIGENNLGDLIHHGIARSNMTMIIAGAIMVTLIAIIIDLGMEFVRRKLISPGLLQSVEVDK